jgi:DNA (cytosine-5)-methyltransferase 1
MTTLPERILSGEVEAPDLFCGGTPCQAFSVAGLRNSLDDARGNLSLTFVGIANAIDHVRSVRSDAPGIIFWENVPGVLSTKDNAFGCFLGALAGEDDPLVPSGGKWTNAGCVYGPQRTVAWRVLDAQYFGVAQRRRRVFVVASARDDFNPAAVLFEFDGVRRDTAPSRETGQAIAGSAATSTASRSWPAEVSSTLDTTFGTKQGLEDQHVNAGCPLFVPAQPMPINTMVALRHEALGEGTGFGIGEAGDPAYTLTKGHSHAVAHVVGALACNTGPNGHDAGNFACNQAVDAGHVLPVAQPINIYGGNKRPDRPKGGFYVRMGEDTSKTLDAASGLNPTCSQGGTAVMQPIIGGVDYENNAHGPDDVTGPLLKGSPTGGGRPLPAIAYEVAMAFRENTRAEVQFYGEAGEVTGALTSGGGKPGQGYPAALVNMAVRRLTPVECSRLQGFPDDYLSQVPWRGKPTPPDGPMYKALGNSWAVPNVRWIGKRIQEALNALP